MDVLYYERAKYKIQTRRRDLTIVYGSLAMALARLIETESCYTCCVQFE